MDFAQAFSAIHWLSVIVAAIASFVLGSLWYTPVLFGKAWEKEVSRGQDPNSKPNMGMIFGLSFILNFLAAFVLDMFIGPDADISFGASAGFMVGFFWVAGSLGVNYLFSRRSLKLFLIDAGYFIVYFVLMGIILGAWK